MANTLLALALASSLFAVADIHVTAASTRQSTKAGITTPKPVPCVQCADLNCFTSPSIVRCVRGSDYCMTMITDTSDGNRKIIKGCSSTVNCQRGFNSTKIQPRCRGIDHQVSGYDITCTFCCKGDNCNAGPHLTPTGGVPFTVVG